MPKRSRYDYVKYVNGQVQIYASDLTYTFENIQNWNSYESKNMFNPEDVEYLLRVLCSSGDQVILCKNESELQSIVEELTEQGI